MQGKIKTFSADKGFGFIKGDDEKDYFFHISSFKGVRPEQLGDGSRVSFDPVPTPKGYRAQGCKVIELVTLGYEAPADDLVLISKTDTIKDWELIEISDWYICSLTLRDKNKAEEHIKSRASMIGANAIINFECERGTGSQGNYNFSVFTCYGRAVFAARKRPGGALDLSERLEINARAQFLKEAFNHGNAKNRRNVKRMWAALIVGMIASLYVLGLGVGAIICAVLLVCGAVYAWNRRDGGGWLARVPVNQ